MNKEISTSLRLDEKLYQQVREAANKEQRSINKEFSVLIQRGLEASGQLPLFK